jgi:uncharacterized cupin superfamily protein
MLGSPVHTHSAEDEYSIVLSGTLTAQVGDEIVEAGPGAVVAKPRGVAHAFWNAGDEPVRFAVRSCGADARGRAASMAPSRSPSATHGW